MNDETARNIDAAVAETVRENANKRPVVPLREAPPATPATAPIASKFFSLDTALGHLPVSFWREARSLAEKHGCADEWGEVEAAHDALRKRDGERTAA